MKLATPPPPPRSASLGPCVDCLARNVDLQPLEPLAARLPPGQFSYFSETSPNPSAPLRVLLRYRREPKSSVRESKVSTSLHPASDNIDMYRGGG